MMYATVRNPEVRMYDLVWQVMEAMGDCATDAEAFAMLDLLQQRGLSWAQAQSLPEDEWLQLLAAAVTAAARQEG